MALFHNNRLNWPTRGDINAWADFVETICMFSEDDSLSIDEFLDFLSDDLTKTNKELLKALNFNDNFFAESAPLVTQFVPINIALTNSLEENGEENKIEGDEEFDGHDWESLDREKIKSRLLVLFTFLKARLSYFGNSYPFEITNNIHMKLTSKLSNCQQLYIVLILSSEMQLFEPGDINRLGHLFESLCRIPFNYLLPTKAKKKFFGAGGGVIMPADYKGNLHDKLVELAKDLNIETKRIIDDPDELSSTGDAGLDWVGWIPFGDECDHQPVYFGQCACGANWIGKQHETSLSVWQNLLDLNQSVQCFHFMPRSFRKNSLDWFRHIQIVRDLTLIDRYRLIKIFETVEKETFDEALNIYEELLKNASEFEYEDQK